MLKNAWMTGINLKSEGLLYLTILLQIVRDTDGDIDLRGERCRSPIKRDRYWFYCSFQTFGWWQVVHLTNWNNRETSCTWAAFILAPVSVSVIFKSCAQEGMVVGPWIEDIDPKGYVLNINGGNGKARESYFLHNNQPCGGEDEGE